MRVWGRLARQLDGAAHRPLEAVGGEVAGGAEAEPPLHEDAQAEGLGGGLGQGGDLAVGHLDLEVRRARGHHVRLGGALPAGQGEHALADVEQQGQGAALSRHGCLPR